MSPCNVSVRNPVCNPNTPIVKYARSHSNVSSSKLVSDSSVSASKPIHCTNVRLSKSITSSFARPNKLISGSNVRSIQPVSVSSICPSKQTCGSNIRLSSTFSAINVQ